MTFLLLGIGIAVIILFIWYLERSNKNRIRNAIHPSTPTPSIAPDTTTPVDIQQLQDQLGVNLDGIFNPNAGETHTTSGVNPDGSRWVKTTKTFTSNQSYIYNHESKTWQPPSGSNAFPDLDEILKAVGPSPSVTATHPPSNSTELFQQGVMDYFTGHLPQALTAFEQASEQGHANALHMLGEMHCHGKGLPLNEPQGRALQQKAAQHGNTLAKYEWAQHTLACLPPFDSPISEASARQKQALAYMHEAAQQQHYGAASWLAKQYLNGNTSYNIPIDYTKAKHWLEVAASAPSLAGIALTPEQVVQSLSHQGPCKAQYQIALLYAQGLGVPQDYQQAAYWFDRAAANNFPHPAAAYALASLYAIKVIQPQPAFKLSTEIAVYQKAGELLIESIDTLSGIALKYKNGTLRHEDEIKRAISQQQYDPPTTPQSPLTEIQALANQGQVKSQYILACRLAYGKGTLTNVKQALHYFELAAGQGHPRAQFELGKLLSDAAHKNADVSAALKWLQQSTQTLATEYALLTDEQVWGLSQNAEAGFTILNAAAPPPATNGSQFECLMTILSAPPPKALPHRADAYMARYWEELNKIFQNNQNTPNSSADFYLNTAATLNHPQALFIKATLCDLYDQPEEALEYIEQARTADSPDALYLLGIMHEDGIAPFEENHQQAIQLYLQAAQMGSPYALYQIAQHCIDFGLHEQLSYSQQNELRLGYLQKAANLNHIMAGLDLGRYNRDGAYGLAINYQQAYQWFERVANTKRTTSPVFDYAEPAYAMAELGMMNLKGQGCPIDFKEATRWLQKAVNTCIESLSYNQILTLANMYYAGYASETGRNGYALAAPLYQKTCEYNLFSIPEQMQYQLDEENLSDTQKKIRMASYDAPTSFNSTLQEIEQLACQGKSNSQYIAGIRYLEGIDTARDPQKAMNYLTQAAQQNHPQALYELGKLELNSHGTSATSLATATSKQACDLLKQAADLLIKNDVCEFEKKYGSLPPSGYLSIEQLATYWHKEPQPEA